MVGCFLTRWIPWGGGGGGEIEKKSPIPPPLEKNRFFGLPTNIHGKVPNESVCSKTSSGTHFGTPKGPETKK